jgi:hypothetical protein
MLDLSLIRIDGGTQSRAKLDESVVAEYAEAYRTGANFPPVIVFYDGKDRWLADGFHRYFGAKQAGKTTVFEKIIPGTKRDAVLYSLGANGTHGLNRTNADKRNAVETMLKDPEWAAWSQEKIAKACNVSAGLVSKLVAELSLHGEEIKPATRTIERTGTTYELDTTNIGKPSQAAQIARETPPKPDIGISESAQTTSSRAQPAINNVANLSRVEELEEEVAVLREQLHEAQAKAGELERIVEANEPLAAAIKDANQQRELARGLQGRINTMMNQIADLQRDVKRLQKKTPQPA